MKFSQIFLVLLLSTNFLLAQFIKDVRDSIIIDLSYSSTIFADVDNDNDLDLFCAGQGIGGIHSFLYINDGTGNFVIDNSNSFEGVRGNNCLFSDIDNDNDADLLVMGMGQSGTMHGLIYSNDGSGNFTLFQELQGASDGFSHFVDVNNDNLQDLIVYGLIGSSNPFNGLYINSNGTLILDEDFPEFTAVRGSISASDIDNDNDVDLFISGFPESKLLLNNGDGSFAVDSTSVATTLNSSSLIFDVDGDNDLDIYIAGFTTQQGVFNQQYTNLGNATFIESNNSTFEPTSEGKLAQVDIDSDDDLDVFIIGRNPENEKVAKLYINEGFGQYTEAFSDTFEGVTNGSLGFGDIDGDLDIDIIISGVNDNFEFVTNIYLNQKLDIVSTSESSSIESEIAFFESRINRSQIEIQISQRLEGETIFTLLNIEGIEFQRIVKQHLRKGDKVILEISNLNNGIYFLNCRNNMSSYSTKLSISK